jgi:hypothetical protein
MRVLENRMMGNISEPKRDKVTLEWRRLHKEGLYDLYCSPNIIQMTKSRSIRWTGYVTPIGNMRGGCKFSVGKPER